MAEEMKAVSIKVDDLSRAVEEAVEDVFAKHDLTAGKGLAIAPGTLIGRMLRGQITDIAGVQKAAADVTAQVSKTLDVGRGALLPAAVIAGGHTTVGFIAQQAIEF